MDATEKHHVVLAYGESEHYMYLTVCALPTYSSAGGTRQRMY